MISIESVSYFLAGGVGCAAITLLVNPKGIGQRIGTMLVGSMLGFVVIRLMFPS